MKVQMMKIRYRVLEGEHPNTLTNIANLTFTLDFKSRTEKAVFLMETCSQLRIKLLDSKHPLLVLPHGTSTNRRMNVR